uniref:Isoform 6 of Pro-neuregulin-1, membrane-bound isoform n=1 Tax=Homo sapiens TaxID=9606 RepID=UPI001D05C284|nr:Chain H, Isoform 6 of Pro-neuregulin-1, membrane-bound isoform [Homo sapiens]7MN6_H Chain H, Isoform 6 of Pro-neuregulin-1, membrane-bound isoform [Homo sapiens]7MN8_H Chain H, Isoform 6 of Pro-neuregulin-1, membrane-bound isoform [Homo sapiens]
GPSHLVKCAEKEKTFCVNGGECFMVKDLSNPSRYLCKCPNEFTGDRCQNYVMASFYKHLGIEGSGSGSDYKDDDDKAAALEHHHHHH